jgi:hypothetical protein
MKVTSWAGDGDAMMVGDEVAGGSSGRPTEGVGVLVEHRTESASMLAGERTASARARRDGETTKDRTSTRRATPRKLRSFAAYSGSASIV